MFDKFFGKTPAAPSAPTVTAPAAQMRPIPAPILELRKQITSKMANPFMDTTYVEPFFQEFLKIAWEYPASDKGHHGESFGLVVHSMGVALKMLESAGTYFKAPVKTPADWIDRKKLYLFLAGISHDLGKIHEWQLDTGGYSFDPVNDSLRTFGRPYSFAGKREDFGYKESAILGGGLMYIILSRVPRFLISHDCSPLELSMVAEAIANHHQLTGEFGNNPYWRALRAADVADIEAYEKAQMKTAAVAAASVINVPPPVPVAPIQPVEEVQIEEVVEDDQVITQEVATTEPAPVAEITAADIAGAAIEQNLIAAVRTLILERLLKVYENSFFVSRAEGFLLLVAPVHVCDRSKARPGIADELGKLLGRNFDETSVVRSLFEASLAVQVGSDESRRYPNLKIETGGKTMDRLMFLPLVASRFFSEDEIATLPSCRIVNLQDFADPEFAIPEIGQFYGEFIKGKLQGEYLAVGIKLLQAYAAEPDTPSVIDDDLQQQDREQPLWQHVLEVASTTVEGAETGDYQMLLVGALAHDAGKLNAAEKIREITSCNHAVAGKALVGKMFEKKGVIKDTIVAMVEHHHAPKTAAGEKIRAAHGSTMATMVVSEEARSEEGGEEVVELVAGEEPLPNVEPAF